MKLFKREKKVGLNIPELSDIPQKPEKKSYVETIKNLWWDIPQEYGYTHKLCLELFRKHDMVIERIQDDNYINVFKLKLHYVGSAVTHEIDYRALSYILHEKFLTSKQGIRGCTVLQSELVDHLNREGLIDSMGEVVQDVIDDYTAERMSQMMSLRQLELDNIEKHRLLVKKLEDAIGK